MTLPSPERDLPVGVRGGSDTWDTGAGAILNDEFFTPAVPSVGRLKVRIGSSWVVKPAKVRISAVWSTATLAVRNASSWLT